jgi:two-component system, LytTR family, response regulator
MINCLVVDDETPAIKILTSYIDKVPYLQLVASTTNPIEGLKIAVENDIDLIFLDIQMPNITGLEFVEALNGKCKVIFTTAYSQYALDGFDLNVIDYLLKPVSFTRFLKATQKANEIFKDKAESKIEENDFLIVKGDNKGKLNKIEIDDIDYIEGMRNYVAIVCGDKKTMSLMNMKDLEDNLPVNKFIRVHKSFIIPISNILSIDGNTILLKRNKNANIIIGGGYKAAFLELMKAKMVN